MNEGLITGAHVFDTLFNAELALQAHARMAQSPCCRIKVYHPLDHRTYVPAYQPSHGDDDDRDRPASLEG